VVSLLYLSLGDSMSLRLGHPACVNITSYNQHCSAPFFRALVVYSYQVYSREGADNVIPS
jgi:hypothetical protein